MKFIVHFADGKCCTYNNHAMTMKELYSYAQSDSCAIIATIVEELPRLEIVNFKYVTRIEELHEDGNVSEY